MTGSRTDIARAEARALAAKAQVQETAARLRLRLDPRVRARETWQDARGKGEVLADDALEFAYEKPRLIAGIAGTGLLLLLRRPLTRLVFRLFRPRRPKWDAPAADIRRIHPAGAPAAGQKGE